MAEMVWCNSCKTVVWAYDHQTPSNLAGICNEFSLPCPICGIEARFDGWGVKNLTKELEEFFKLHPERGEVYDLWSAMKHIARFHNVEWYPSKDNRWFPKEQQ